MKYLLLIIGIFTFHFVNAQNDWRLYGVDNESVEDTDLVNDEVIPVEEIQPGTLVIYSDPKIDTLLAIIDKNPPSINGYRLEIFFGQRKDAERVKSEFLKSYSEYPIYVIWQQPNFKVQVGDFMTKLQAEKTQQEIKGKYPNAYITLTDIKVSDD